MNRCQFLKALGLLVGAASVPAIPLVPNVATANLAHGTYANSPVPDPADPSDSYSGGGAYVEIDVNGIRYYLRVTEAWVNGTRMRWDGHLYGG